MTYADLQNSIGILGLSERATLKEIKASHRRMVKLHHPDTGEEENPEIIRQVNAAYGVVLDYVGEYRFSFAEREFYQQNPEERLLRQFMDDPLWGNK